MHGSERKRMLSEESSPEFSYPRSNYQNEQTITLNQIPSEDEDLESKEQPNETQVLQNLASALSSTSSEPLNSIKSSNDANNKPYMYGISAALLVSALGVFLYWKKIKSSASKEKLCDVTLECTEIKSDESENSFTVLSF